jgi:imidazolonepropionase-like amidohydrolase
MGRSILAATAATATVLVAGGCAAHADALAAADLVIVNVNVVDVVAGMTLPGRTVTVRDGRIAGVHEARDAATPTAGRLLDGSGRYLVPGLWDMHVHFRGGVELAADNAALLPLYIANGVTTVRDAGGDITSSILEWRRSIEAGERIGPRILTSGPKLDGMTGGWDGSIRLGSLDAVPAAVDSLQALGADYIKIYDGTIGRDVYLAIIEEAERRDLIVTGHMPMSVRFHEAVERGLDATEHLYYAFKGGAANEDSVTTAVIARLGTAEPLGFRETLHLLRQRYDEAVARATFEAMALAGTAVVPTLHIGAVLAVVDETDHSGDAALRYIPPAIEATYAGRVAGARRASAEARAERHALQRIFFGMVRPMHAAGVTILAGSDAGPFNSYVYPGFSLHDELDQLVAAGLSPLEALRSATLHAAAFMRLDHEYGRVAEGYRADLVLLDADPLDDIRHTRRVSAVVFGGAVFDAADLAAMLASAER